MTALLNRQENIAIRGNGDMNNLNRAFMIPLLCLPFQFQIVLHQPEKHLDIQPLAIDAYDLLVREINLGGQTNKPLMIFVSMAYKYSFHLLFFFVFRHSVCKNHGQHFNLSFVATSEFVKLLIDVLEPLISHSRRTKKKVQRQETISIRPALGEQLKPLQSAATIVVKDPHQQFNELRARLIIGGIVNAVLSRYFPLLIRR